MRKSILVKSYPSVLYVVMGFLFVGCIQDPQQPASPTPTLTLTPELGQIITNYGQLKVYNSDGTDQARLPAAGETPRWSPDGTRILFKSSYSTAVRLGPELQQDYPASPAIMVADADGSNVKTLYTFYRGGDPDWSPSGDQIVFAAAFAPDEFPPVNTRPDLYVMNNDGSRIRLLLDCSDIMGGCRLPRWSPDGETIAFISEKLELIDVNGFERKTLYPREVFGFLEWSPSGEELLLQQDNALYILNLDSGQVEEIDRKEENEDITYIFFYPAWSPSGEQVLYGLTYEDKSLWDTSNSTSPSRPLRRETWIVTRDGSIKAQIPGFFIDGFIDWKAP